MNKALDYHQTIARLEEIKSLQALFNSGIEIGVRYGDLTREFLSLKRSLARKKKDYENGRITDPNPG